MGRWIDEWMMVDRYKLSTPYFGNEVTALVEMGRICVQLLEELHKKTELKGAMEYTFKEHSTVNMGARRGWGSI